MPAMKAGAPWLLCSKAGRWGALPLVSRGGFRQGDLNNLPSGYVRPSTHQQYLVPAKSPGKSRGVILQDTIPSYSQLPESLRSSASLPPWLSSSKHSLKPQLQSH